MTDSNKSLIALLCLLALSGCYGRRIEVVPHDCQFIVSGPNEGLELCAPEVKS